MSVSRSPSCGRFSLRGETPEGLIVAIPIRCRRWSCEFCRERLKRNLVDRIKTTSANALLTLTCNPTRYPTPEDAFHGLSAATSLLVKRLRRYAAPHPVEYLLVWEVTKAGWPHAHILLRSPYLPQRMISKAWQELVGAVIIDIRGVKTTEGAMEYVAKYLAKEPVVPLGMKRYRTSQNFFNETLVDRPGLALELHNRQIVPASTTELLEEAKRTGQDCFLFSDGVLIIAPPGVLPRLSFPLDALRPSNSPDPPPGGGVCAQERLWA